MEDILRELGNLFDSYGILGSVFVALPMGLVFWLAARENAKQMKKSKEEENKK